MKLSREFEEVTRLVGSMIVGRLLTAAYGRDSRPDTEEDRPHFCIYADEFQNFATPDFAKLFEETGKFHYALTVAHQERASQFEQHDKNRGATKGAASIVVFRTIVDDAQEFAPEFAKKPPPGETRLEPVRTVITDPVGWLCSGRGHPDDVVNTFVQTTLMPFVNNTPRIQSQDTINYLNQYFHVWMTTKPDKDTAFKRLYSRALSIPNGVVANLIWWSSEYHPGLSNCVYLLRENEEEFFNKRWARALLEENARKSFRDAKELFVSMWLTMPPLTSGSTRGVYRSVFREYKLVEVLGSILYDLFYDPRLVRTEYNETYKEDRSLEEATSFLQFIDDLRFVTLALTLHPIEEASGQYVEKPGTQRTFADMVNEMALELPNLPRYTAYCKVVKEVAGVQKILKYQLYPDPLSYVSERQLFLAVSQRKKIEEQTHKLYCTERTKVEAEITTRREYLKKPVKKQKQTQQDDEE